MSPANTDDDGSGLTRREIRARERARLEAEAAAKAEAGASSSAPEEPESVQYAEPERQVQAVEHEEAVHYAQPEASAPAPGHEPEAYYVPAHGGEDHLHDADGGSHSRAVQPDHGHYAYESAGHADLHAVEGHPVEGYHPEADAHYPGYHYADHQHEEHHVLPGATPVPAPSRKVRHRRRLLALLLTLAVFVTAIVVGVQFLRPLLGMDRISDYPGPGTGQVQVAVDPGEGTRSLAAKLEAAGVVADAGTFEGAFAASGKTLKPGEYSFREEMNNAGAIEVLAGEEGAKVVYFALNAGLRINESLSQIAEGAGVGFSELEALSNQPSQFGLPAAAKNLEGFLAPGEYRFEVGTPAKEILQKLVSATVNELVSQGISDPAKQYEAVIVASIVQAEGGLADYGNVAGAIYNRLEPNDETNGYLQVDSAVTYGLGTKSFNFTDEQRADKSNPYNTYANPGLPPGPIGSPGKTAIDAAAKPAANDYLYWVTINLDSKETKFSSTLAEHNGYVKQYNAWCESNPGRCT